MYFYLPLEKSVVLIHLNLKSGWNWASGSVEYETGKGRDDVHDQVIRKVHLSFTYQIETSRWKWEKLCKMYISFSTKVYQFSQLHVPDWLTWLACSIYIKISRDTFAYVRCTDFIRSCTSDILITGIFWCSFTWSKDTYPGKDLTKI